MSQKYIYLSTEEKNSFKKSLHDFDAIYVMENCSDSIKDDKECMFLAIDKNPHTYSYASERLKMDYDFIIYALKCSQKDDEYDLNLFFKAKHKSAIAQSIVCDKKFVKRVLDTMPQMYKYFKYFHKNEEITLYSINSESGYPKAYDECSTKIKESRDFIKKVLATDADCLKYMSNKIKLDPELINIAINNNPRKAFEHAGSNWESVSFTYENLTTAFKRYAIALDVQFRYVNYPFYDNFLEFASNFKEDDFIESLKNLDVSIAKDSEDELPSLKSLKTITFILNHISQESLRKVNVTNTYLKEQIDRAIILKTEIIKIDNKKSRKLTI